MKRAFVWILAIVTVTLTGPLLSVAGTAGTESAAAQQPPSASAAPAMVIDQTTFDFGTAEEGTVVTHAFKVKNTGTAVLTINQVRPG
jgi:hypothetical protein